MKAVCVALACCTLLLGCGSSEDWHGRGHRDGYAVGYNTACQIRTTLVTGEWDNEDYAKGYAEGLNAGAAACMADGGPEAFKQ